MIDLTEKLKNLPDSPGVYIMLDKSANVIYVGKAKVLKNRVRQYFHNSPKPEKVTHMVEKIADFNYIITKSEKDALNLESTLIKKYKPYYNILLKDDKNYPYIKANMTESYPSFTVTRKFKNDKNKYFGPFMAGIRYRDILEILAICFKIKLCKTSTDTCPKSRRPCLNYHIGRCLAPCMGYVSKEEYAKNVAKAINFLQGSEDEAQMLLTEKMQNASLNEDYETAIVYRDRLKMLEIMREKVLTFLGKDVSLDIMKYVSDDSYGALSLILVRGGKIVGSENYPITALHLSEAEVYSAFMLQYYKNGVLIPPEIICGTDINDGTDEYLSLTSGYKVHITTPKQGMRAQLLDMARSNATDYLLKSRDKIKQKEDMTTGAINALSHYLNIPPPYRMECFDISNISGTDKVASMTVFINGEAERSHYRRFKIKTVEGANDFASMKEVLTRRLLHLTDDEKDTSFSMRPDLIVVDGGKGQLSYALEALGETQHSNLNIISLAERDEEIFVPNKSLPIVLPKSSVALKLLQRIRDEAHRFAITYFRNVHGSKMLVSSLDEISGVGKKRRQALITHFKSLAKLKQATVSEIATVDNIGVSLATKIKESLNNNEVQNTNQ